MELYVVDAFTEHIYGGNQAGVVLLDRTAEFPDAALMQQIAAELKHSETAFVKRIDSHLFSIRYFTPEGEVDLCGHATISAFTALREEKALPSGKYTAKTAAGEIPVTIEPDCIWMGMAPGKLIKVLSDEEASAFYRAYGLCIDDKPSTLQPCIVSTGLPDILLPVDSIDKLTRSVQSKEEVIRLSQKHQVVGVHMYYPALSAQVTARCRNFAPLYGIDEEAATGTSNGALTYYLHSQGRISEQDENTFIQGESMGKPSIIKSRIGRDKIICVGGSAVISIRGWLKD
ncbi:PhzF family phenazine biosynthesis protein [Clostridium sp. KNHs216]|uniref:PhzF family phenazine biosynthesis protein n=1 Tax=Clostridium sp. KNHs216 TaxID=1550235 RepID=UPI001150F3DB|nr:PhzF family phenazine biosynthesis protein [Clostridium sp. KNHs216]TQI66563.1 PhzF family phenazine biosynthesis protein [Clostridium sp. KNHs216]